MRFGFLHLTFKKKIHFKEEKKTKHKFTNIEQIIIIGTLKPL